MARRKSTEHTLVNDLRRQVTHLVDDLRSLSESDEVFGERLVTEHQRALDARRIAVNYTDWREDRLTQIAVAWVLATVFVRYCEDNELIEHPWLSGPGERLKDAEDRHAAFFRDHPEKNDRDWLLASFDHLASTHPAVAGLFDKAHNPLWEADPSYEAAAALLKFWRTPDAEGNIRYTFKGHDTRFLGDLYQDLSDHAKKTYALLQTPEFVEEFILDLTLTPAIEEFGLEPVWRHTPAKWRGQVNEDGEAIGLRTIDPACGSGHFLLGLFKRILAAWDEKAPGLPRWDRIRRALDSVHGCDKNPFAAAIARFRLLIAALNAADEKRLEQAPAFPINIAVGDSLLHGRGMENVTTALFSIGESFTFSTEDVFDYTSTCDLLGLNSYHATVGNPPYITVKDKQENDNYRKAHKTCSGKYALSVPFAQRVFDLTVNNSEHAPGFTGQITSNSFMKREFGAKLIDWFHSEIELTHVIDTSGAHIPGHGTPTVILAGRNQIAPSNRRIRTVLGSRGEPGLPEDPSKGFVWSAIIAQIEHPGSESEWVSVVDLEGSALKDHPWSLSGGGAHDLQTAIESAAVERLANRTESIGIMSVTGEDDLFLLPKNGAAKRLSIKETRPMATGEAIRDYSAISSFDAIWTCDDKYKPANYVELGSTQKLLSDYRTSISQRKRFGVPMLKRGMNWHEWQELYDRKLASPLSITFAFVATHNHFALDRGGKVFNRSAPVIKFPESASENDHIALLGLLNSSTACFWLKQVSQGKGGSGLGRGHQDENWEERYEFTGTKLQEFPVPKDSPLPLSKLLDSLAQESNTLQPAAVCAAITPTREALDTARAEYGALRARMIALQEELDWQVYGLYGLLSPRELTQVTFKSAEAPQVRLGERAFEIVLARKAAVGQEETAWFTRHRSEPRTEIPEHWGEEYAEVVRARIKLIEERPDLGLLEQPENKRRWSSDPWEVREREAVKGWILDRCEREGLWFSKRDGLQHPNTMTVSELADRFRSDEDMNSVAQLFVNDHLGKRDLPLSKILEEILKEEHVPYLAALRYKDSGLRKRAEWEKTWELQREEDRTGQQLAIPVPPKYSSADFRKPAYWSHRGKLDMPKERFISYPGAARHSDDPLLLGWAGWDHKDQAQALVNLVNDRTQEDQWGREQLVPLLAGLVEVMPWVKQWHGEYDAEWDGNPAEEFQAFLEDQLSTHQLSEQVVREWRPSKEFLKGAKA